MLLEPLTRN
jgi:hypothetical protein